MLVLVAVGGGVKDLIDHGIEGLMYSFLGGSAPPGSYFNPGMVCVEESYVVDQQDGGSYCQQHDHCTHIEPGTNEGLFVDQNGDITALVIKAGREYTIYESGVTDDGCYYVNIQGDTASWRRVDSGPDCKDISHLQMWYDTFMADSAEQCADWDRQPPPY